MAITIRNPETGETKEVENMEDFNLHYANDFEIDVSADVSDEEGGLESLTRAELDARAESLGVNNPQGMANKAEVITAIEEAEAE